MVKLKGGWVLVVAAYLASILKFDLFNYLSSPICSLEIPLCLFQNLTSRPRVPVKGFEPLRLSPICS